jgi:hypothetical protein
VIGYELRSAVIAGRFGGKMEIELRTRDASLPTFFQEFTELRLRFALDRYGTRIRRVRVWVAAVTKRAASRLKLFLLEFW